MSGPVEPAVRAHYDTGKHKWDFGSPFRYECGKVTSRYCGPCPMCGLPTQTYGGGYSCTGMYCQKSASQFVCNPGPAPDWWNTDVRVFLDGNAWCAVGAGFENLQESPVGFGDTPQAAVNNLRANAALSGPHE